MRRIKIPNSARFIENTIYKILRQDEMSTEKHE